MALRRDIIGEAPVQEQGKPFAAPHMLSAREESDNYKDVVAVLNPKLRVILAKDDLQRIVQRQNNKRGGLPIWSSFAFCATKEGLLLRIKEHWQQTSHKRELIPLERLVGQHCEPGAWAIIEALPDYYPK